MIVPSAVFSSCHRHAQYCQDEEPTHDPDWWVSVYVYVYYAYVFYTLMLLPLATMTAVPIILLVFIHFFVGVLGCIWTECSAPKINQP